MPNNYLKRLIFCGVIVTSMTVLGGQMDTRNLEKIQNFLTTLSNLNSEQMMSLVESQLTDEGVELFVDHIQEFYGIEDDEELGTLAQLMVTGYLAAKAEMGMIEENKVQ
jgi:hypothetical protein